MGDDDYFASYGDLETHELMLKDAPRLAAYAAAVEANASFIRGRAVLDVGAGTGILSLLCARAGARAVYAVEASPMAEHLRDIVERNGFAGVITVLQSVMEETALPEQVDVVISEWMGFHLLHEARTLWSCAPALCTVSLTRAAEHAR
jgi:predicted RNA methylase